VVTELGDGRLDIDVKRYAKIEKIPGGDIEDSRVLKGVMFNKDITHPKMRRSIKNPRILLMDTPLEYKKGENTTSVELTKEEDWQALLALEEAYIKNLCDHIIALKPDLVVTEKGCSDLAQHFLMKADIAVIRRLRKTDNNRIARACGATIVHRVQEMKDSDIGTRCGHFEVKKIGDEYFSFVVDCDEPKACTILLRGASKDVLNEVERNLHDAMNVTRNIYNDPRLVPGGGAAEMAISQGLREKAKSMEGTLQSTYKNVGAAMEVIPRTLAQNCGADTIRVITELRSLHAGGANTSMGIDGEKGNVADAKTLGIWEPYKVKAQTIKTAVECTCMLLRIDDIVSGMKKANNGTYGQGAGAAPEHAEEMMETQQ